MQLMENQMQQQKPKEPETNIMAEALANFYDVQPTIDK